MTETALVETSTNHKKMTNETNIDNQVQYDDEPTIIDPPMTDSRHHSPSNETYSNSYGNHNRESIAARNERGATNLSANQSESENSIPSHRKDPNKAMDNESHKADDGEDCTTLYIRNLPEDFRSEDIRNEFSKFGEIVDSRVVINPVTKDSRGFGFVSFCTVDMCEEALAKMDGVEIRGKQLRIEKAKRNRPHDPTPGEYKGPTGASIKYDNRGRLKPGYVPYWDLPYPKGGMRGSGYDRHHDRGYPPVDSRGGAPSGSWSPRDSRRPAGYYSGANDQREVQRYPPSHHGVHCRPREVDSRAPPPSYSRYSQDYHGGSAGYEDRRSTTYENRSHISGGGRSRPTAHPYPIRGGPGRSRSPPPRGKSQIGYGRRSQSPPPPVSSRAHPDDHHRGGGYSSRPSNRPYESGYHHRGSSAPRHYSPTGAYSKPSSGPADGRYHHPSQEPKSMEGGSKYPPAYRGSSRDRYPPTGPTSERPYGHQPPRDSRDLRTGSGAIPSGSHRYGSGGGLPPVVRRQSVEETQPARGYRAPR